MSDAEVLNRMQAAMDILKFTDSQDDADTYNHWVNIAWDRGLIKGSKGRED